MTFWKAKHGLWKTEHGLSPSLLRLTAKDFQSSKNIFAPTFTA
jgi:hypothetical protein